MTDWFEYQDDISDAISDSMDMDWSANDGARAVVRWLNENKPLSTTPRVTVPVEPTELIRLSSETAEYLIRVAEDADDNQWQDWAATMRQASRQMLGLCAMLSAAPAPEGGAVKGPGDYTMALAEPQAFERFPALAPHIERMAIGGSVGSLVEWDAFLKELNAALATREEAPAEAGALINQIDALLAIPEANLSSRIPYLARELLERSAKHLRAQPPARSGEGQ